MVTVYVTILNVAPFKWDVIMYKSSHSHPPSSLRSVLLQMDPKLRPSFPEIVRHLEEILARLKVEEMEHECVPLSADNNDKKTIPKGMNAEHTRKSTLCSSVICRFSFRFTLIGREAVIQAVQQKCLLQHLSWPREPFTPLYHHIHSLCLYYYVVRLPTSQYFTCSL